LKDKRERKKEMQATKKFSENHPLFTGHTRVAGWNGGFQNGGFESELTSNESQQQFSRYFPPKITHEDSSLKNRNTSGNDDNYRNLKSNNSHTNTNMNGLKTSQSYAMEPHVQLVDVTNDETEVGYQTDPDNNTNRNIRRQSSNKHSNDQLSRAKNKSTSNLKNKVKQ
jgi:hypothetical protein